MNRRELDYDLLPLLPPWYAEVLDYQQICHTEEQQFAALANEITAVAQNFFFQTMDESAVTQWEQIFGILANPQTDTLEFRQARLLNRMSSRPPYTIWFLKQKLDELIGPNQWTVTMDYPNYTLYIESAAENQAYATEVEFTINKIKPAHIVYINKPYVNTGILLSETISLTQRVYNYRLGSWGLGVYPFASQNTSSYNYRLGEWRLGGYPFITQDPMEVIKTATVPSIQPTLLEGVANFVSGDIASALINGSIAINDIAKSVSGSTLQVTYTVPQDAATSITSMALLDALGNILTQSNVYVPVTGATVLTHTIPVAEGVTNNE